MVAEQKFLTLSLSLPWGLEPLTQLWGWGLCTLPLRGGTLVPEAVRPFALVLGGRSYGFSLPKAGSLSPPRTWP